MIINYERYQLKNQKKRKKFLFLLLIVIFVLAFVVGLFFLLQTPNKPVPVSRNIDPDQDLTILWEKRYYDKIISICDYNLKQKPLDHYYLIYRGFSYFHKAKNIYDAVTELFLQHLKFSYKQLDINKYLALAQKTKEKLSGLIQSLQNIYTDHRLQNYQYFKEFSEASSNIEKLKLFLTACISLFDEGIISLRRALLLEHIDIKYQIYYILGKAYFFKGESFLGLSIKYLELAFASGTKEFDLYEYLATAYEINNNLDKAVQFLEEAYNKKQIDVYLYYLAKYNWKLNNLNTAEEYLDNLMNKSKDKELLFQCKLLLGNIYFDKKEYIKAKELYNDILDEFDSSAEAHYRLALIYEQLGDYAKYRSELRKAYSLNPNIEDVRSRLYN